MGRRDILRDIGGIFCLGSLWEEVPDKRIPIKKNVIPDLIRNDVFVEF